MSTRRPTKSRKTNSSKSKKRKVFTTEDYNSNDGMMTSIWGPPMWHILHTISFNYKVNPSEEEKEQYKQFILSLQHVLPCRACRENLKSNLKATNFGDHVFRNRETFSKYIFNLHQKVNEMLGKKNNLTYEIVRDRYENFRARCGLKLENSQQQVCGLETGCTVPITGIKSKCVMRIIPFITDTETFKIDDNCVCKRTNTKKTSHRKSV